MVDRISSLDSSYSTGDLSIYPEAKDSKTELYEVKNNAETFLTHSLSYNGKYLVVDSTSTFPDQGLLLVGTEIIYYDSKTATLFTDLKRGFAGSRQNYWPKLTKIGNTVMAEPHNTIKDAIINIETNLGTEESPDATSLNGILKSLEERFLAPKPVFRASVTKGPAPLTVQFQNFTTGDPIRFLWQFDGSSQSTETAPSFTYMNEGTYSVKLNMITSLGAVGVSTKTDYITVDNNLKEGFYYTNELSPGTFEFIDQTPGDVKNRYFIFGDGVKESQDDPDVHTAIHTYSAAGEYETALIVVMSDGKVIKYTADPVVVE